MSQPFRDTSNRSAATTPVSKMMRGIGEMSLSKTPGSAGRSRALFATKTPTHGLNQSVLCGKKGALKRREVTPSRNQNFNGVGGADRYIPNRSSSHLELANYHLTQSILCPNSTFNTSSSAPSSPAKQDPEKQKFLKMMRVKSTSDLQAFPGDEEDRILIYKQNCAPAPPVGYMNSKVLYTACVQPSSSVKRTSRFIPTAPEKILDAPQLINDYYTELLDWSSLNVVSVALSKTLYLWNAETEDITVLLELPEENDFDLITTVKWSNEGKFLAVGFNDGTIKLFDPSRDNRPELRKLQVPRTSRVSSVSWKGHVISAGYKSGQIIHHDVRVKEHVIGIMEGHSQTVCGLDWSSDAKLLASGGGDNVVNVWDERKMNTRGEAPLYVLDDHTASVKAVRFCSFKRSVLASGGGQTDMTVKLWNMHTGELQKTISAGAQVTAIRFNDDYKEMIASLGNPLNELKIWKAPNYTEVASLAGHTDRILGLAMSPCGQKVMSASCDETLRTWDAFKVDKSTRRHQMIQKMPGMESLR